MKVYPILLNLDAKPCLVVGGGSVATRKVQGLLAGGAAVTLVSPAASPALADLAAAGQILWHPRGYRETALDGMALAIAATNDRELNRRVQVDARRLGILCSVVDQPELCDFTVPAVVRRGDLVLSVSTAGRSPALAKQIRKELESRFGDEYEAFLHLMGAVRQHLLAAGHDPDGHRDIFTRLVQSDLLDCIRDDRRADAALRLREILGPDYDETLLNTPFAASASPRGSH